MFKKSGNYRTVAEIVEKNTGMDQDHYLHPDPMPYIHNLKEAVAFFKNYVAEHDNPIITIVGDYDVDGIDATTILYHAIFKYMGIPPKTRLPKRFSEGYGLSVKIIDEINSGLVITVDNGIAAAEAVRHAKDKGLAVIVTDHHMPPVDEYGQMILPEPDILVDPYAEDLSEYKGYCGAGLAYRFAQELLPGKNLKKLLVFASIATVADVMPITGPNWLLVREGLKAINSRRVMPGLDMVLEKQKMGNHIQEDDFGFQLGPIFNASGRLEDDGASKVLEVMKVTPNDYRKPRLPWKVDELISNNEKRKEIVKKQLETITVNERPIVLYIPGIGEGIIGIIAGQLAEKYYCPAIVFTNTASGMLKGSGRTIPEIHLKRTLDQIKGIMAGYGGHAGAAGLSIREADLEQFHEAFKKACGIIPEKPKDIYYDMELSLSMLSDVLAQQKEFAPYGAENPKPVFRIQLQINPANFQKMGDGSHFRISGDPITLMGFGLTEKYEKLGCPSKLDCVGHLNENWFNGKCSLQFELIDFEVIS